MNTPSITGAEMVIHSIAVSLKRMEIEKVVELKKWCCLKGFKDFHSSAWLAICDKERKLNDELDSLMTTPTPKPASEKPRVGNFPDSPNNCPVIERDGDGKECGRCWFYLNNGVCPRHGLIPPSPHAH